MIKYKAKLKRGGFEHVFFLAWEQSQSNFLLNNLFPLVVLREVSQFIALPILRDFPGVNKNFAN